MSHFTRIKTQIVVEEYLLKALQDLNCRCEVGELTIRAVGGARQPVHIKVSAPQIGRDIGFRRSGETFEMVADWWGVRSHARQDFQQKLLQRYAFHTALGKLQAQGFDLVNQEMQQDGQVHLTLRRMA